MKTKLVEGGEGHASASLLLDAEQLLLSPLACLAADAEQLLLSPLPMKARLRVAKGGHVVLTLVRFSASDEFAQRAHLR